MKKTKNIVVDFDGTIMPYSFPEVDKPFPSTRFALNEIKKMGYNIIIHSVRTASYWYMIGDNKIPRNENQVELIKNYMIENNLPFDAIWLADKPLAKYYIDDRALQLKNGDWDLIINKIKEEHYV